MRRLFPIVVALSLILPRFAFAADAFPTAVYQASNQVYQPANATGAADGQYTTFFSDGAVITLDFGTEVKGDVTLTYQFFNFGAGYSLTWYDAAWLKLATQGNTLPLGTEVTVPYAGTSPYRYVAVTDINANQWKLDALKATAVSAPVPIPVPEPTPVPAPAPAQGALVKLPNDGNPATTYDAAVYEIGADAKRHAFPSESVFYSWYVDFSGVQTVTADVMSSYALGKNVTVHPGSKLVKITTDPKVYAVEPGGVLRPIASESIAISLYGSAWASQVIDIPDVFFLNYTIGTSIDAGPITTQWNIQYPY